MVWCRAGMEAGSAAHPSPPAPPAAPHTPHTPHPLPHPNTDTPNGTAKILGRNANGTMVVTTAPNNEAELQLYRVLQRASLLAYYDTLLEMGGDDVQQLCDAGEEEFLEIMALVGMASKPLHVRRLQKALHEWVTNPGAFQIPIAPVPPPVLHPSEPSFLSCSPRLLGLPQTHPVTLHRSAAASPENSRPMYSPSPGIPESSCGSNSSAPNASPVHVVTTNLPTNSKISVTPTSTTNLSTNNTRSYSPHQPTCPTSSNSSPSSVPCSPVQLTPCLLESQVQRLASAAQRLSLHLPQLEPKPQNAKKKMCKDLEAVMMMPDDDPRRMEEIRKYAAIYGRFDCKRKPEKPLTLHEVSVNEAAAQMCRAVPALLTRRDELFPLARQVVRLSGFHYSKGQSQISSTCSSRSRSESEGGGGGGAGERKRPRLERGEGGKVSSKDQSKPADSNKSADDDDMLRSRGGGEGQGDGEGDIRHSFSSTSGMWTRPDSEDGDSRYSFSNSCSPPLHEQDDIRVEGETESSGGARVRVVAASGDHIIAVANPALELLSRTLVPKRECPEPMDNNN